MLETIDLSKRIPKAAYKKQIGALELKLGELQRQARDLNIPSIVLFEGWGASGKGIQINRLQMALDPRGFTVYSTKPADEEAAMRPFLWRFWIKTPPAGRMTIFDRSWYGRFLVERMEGTINKKQWTRAHEEVNCYERQLIDGGAVFIKFFLHISKAKQRKRFRALEQNEATAWRVTRRDWKKNRRYNAYLRATEEMIAETDTEHAPWTVVEAHDWRHANIRVISKLIETLQERIEAQLELSSQQRTARRPRPESYGDFDTSSALDTVDLTLSMEKAEYTKLRKACQKRIYELEHEAYRKRLPVVIVYQGWDAAGKGGNIKRLVAGMDPRGYEVIPIAAPNDIEKAHHYLWRFYNGLPKAGHIAIFDRSWYGRVLVERIEGFCTEAEWRRAYREINEMEKHLDDFGTVVIKFWLEIDKDEQLRRFQARQGNPHKAWKITDEDLRNREKWDSYREAVREMIYRTSTPYAPWTIVEANSKYYARIKSMRTVIERLEARLG
jgi:AMP-polyphosphate phosphotransferase